jgi:hypothetical protein
MVSPAETGGGDATVRPGPRQGSPADRASEGIEHEVAVTYTDRLAFAEPSGAAFESQFLSRREPEHERWSTQDITPPSEALDIYGDYNLGTYFTPELSEGVANPRAALTPEAFRGGLLNLYRVNFTDPLSYELLSRLPSPYAEPYNDEKEVFPLGAASNLSRVVFETGVGLEDPSPLFEYANGAVHEIGVSNTDESWVVSVGYHSGPGSSSSATKDVWHAMSASGLRTVMDREAGGELFVRQNGEEGQSPMKDLGLPGEECEDPAAACTIKLSAGAARYWGADSEDTKIFYTEGGPGSEDLYEYTLPAGQVKGQAVALTHGGEVQGVAQIAEDGSYVYFVAKGALKDEHGETLKNISGVEPESGEDNLYVSREGALAFVATLSADDAPDWEEGPGDNLAVLSPGGTRLAFVSDRSLTGYDNQPAHAGECEGETTSALEGDEDGKCREIYVYDAASGALTCASCNPTGARPVGGVRLSPGRNVRATSNYRPRALLEDGALFFESADALVPGAPGGTLQVYESVGGHIYAISHPDGQGSSYFVDASPSGQDVFFATAEKLVPQDRGEAIVVYDARVDGGFPVTSAPLACEDSASCQPFATPGPAAFGSPATASLTTPENLAPPAPVVVKKTTTKKVKCAKGKKLSKGKCVKKSKSKKAKAKRATNDRRGK